MVRLNKKEKKERGLTYAPVTLLVIALPILMVTGMGIAAAEVVRMKKKKWWEGTHCRPTHHCGCCGCGRRHGCAWVGVVSVVVVVVSWLWLWHGHCGGGCIIVVVVVVVVGCGWWWWW